MASPRTGQLIAASRAVLLLALALLLLAPEAGAGDVRIGSESSYSLSREFSYLIDPTDKLKLTDMAQPAVQARFQPLRLSSPAWPCSRCR